MKQVLKNHSGFTFIEIVMVIIMLAIVSGIATRKFINTIETSKVEATKSEMEALAHALVGDPGLYTNGARSDFGYVGDVGALPAGLESLFTNPGSYTTWDGPYIRGDVSSADFKTDAWGVAYVFTDTMIRSTGSGSNIDKKYASNPSSSLLGNTVSGFVVDANQTPPGTSSSTISVKLTYPNGTGGTTTSSTAPSSRGSFSFSNIPVGNHTLTVIYSTATDTITMPICVTPSSTVRVAVIFPSDLW